MSMTAITSGAPAPNGNGAAPAGNETTQQKISRATLIMRYFGGERKVSPTEYQALSVEDRDELAGLIAAEIGAEVAPVV